MGKRKLKIAFIGIRGIPVVYSGFETLVEKIATELAKRKYEVSVYCRKPLMTYSKKKYKGVRLFNLDTIKSKNLETWIHSYCATYDIITKHRQDLVFVIGVGSSIFSLVLRLFGIKTVVHVDGLDWKREKWGLFAKWYLHFSELIAAHFPNRTLTDSEFVKSYYSREYAKNIELIGYGADITKERNSKLINKIKLKRGGYFMLSGRLVPDNHFEEAIKAYMGLESSYPLVIVGDCINDSTYKNKLYKLSENQNIIFTGFIEKPEYYTLLENSYMYIETKRSGGTHPSLVEASKLCKRIVCVNNEAHKKVLGNGAIYYPMGNIAKFRHAITTSIKQSVKDINTAKKIRSDILNANYNWGKIISKYEELILEVI